MSWVSHFDNADWQAVSGAEWTGSLWSLPLTGGASFSQLEVSGSWYKGYFPRHIRVTIDDNNSNLSVEGSGGSILASAGSYPSLTALPLSYPTSASDEQIYRLNLDWGVSPSATYQITGIDFNSCYVTADDDFTGTNGDPPNGHKWLEFSSGTGDGPEIQGNALRVSVGSGVGTEGVNSYSKFIGDFDFQVDFNIIAGADIGTQAWNAGLEARFIDDEDNRARMSIDGHTTTYIGSSKVGGVSDGDASPTPETSGSFRITRSGSTFNCYYQDSGWQLLHTKSIGTSACEVRLYVENSVSNPLGTVDFDNFTATYDDSICANSSSSSSSSSVSSSSSSSSSVSSSSVSSSSVSSSSVSSSSVSSSSVSSSSVSSSSSSLSSSSSSSSSSESSSSSSESSSSSSQSSSSSSSSISLSLSSSSLSSSSSVSSSSSISSSSSSSSSFFDASRTHFWHYVVDEEGRPIQNAQIRLFLDDDPTVEASIFLTEIIASHTTTSISNILTDNNGFFEFWLGGEWEDGGYSPTQSFRLEWYKAGIAPGAINDVNPWPNAFSWVDTNIGADKDTRNKFISDFLGKKWYDHVLSHVPSGSPHDLHPVNVNLTCLNSDNRFNKVVSNKLLNDIWTDSVGASIYALTFGGVNEHRESITSWLGSGPYYQDITHTDIISKSVSVQVSKLSDQKQVEPKEVINISFSQTRIYMDEAIDVEVNIQGSSSSSSRSSSSSYTPTRQWEKVFTSPDGQQMNAVGIDFNEDIYMVGDEAPRLYYSTGHGTGTWTVSPSADPLNKGVGGISSPQSGIRSFLYVKPTVMMMGSYDTGFPNAYKSIDGGITWIAKEQMDTRAIESLVYDSVADVIIAATWGGPYIWRSTDDGESFTNVQTLTGIWNRVFDGCYDSTNDELYVTGSWFTPSDGNIWKSIDHGLTWFPRADLYTSGAGIPGGFGGNLNVYSIIHDPAHDVLIAGTGDSVANNGRGQIWTSEDRGVTWTMRKDLYTDSAERGIVCLEYDSTQQRVMAGTQGRGELWNSFDGGLTWSRELQLSSEFPSPGDGSTNIQDIIYDSVNDIVMLTATNGPSGSVWLWHFA